MRYLWTEFGYNWLESWRTSVVTLSDKCVQNPTYKPSIVVRQYTNPDTDVIPLLFAMSLMFDCDIFERGWAGSTTFYRKFDSAKMGVMWEDVHDFIRRLAKSKIWMLFADGVLVGFVEVKIFEREAFQFTRESMTSNSSVPSTVFYSADEGCNAEIYGIRCIGPWDKMTLTGVRSRYLMNAAMQYLQVQGCDAVIILPICKQPKLVQIYSEMGFIWMDDKDRVSLCLAKLAHSRGGMNRTLNEGEVDKTFKYLVGTFMILKDPQTYE